MPRHVKRTCRLSAGITKAARDRWSSGGPAEETAEWTQHTSRSACQPEAGRILRAWGTRRVLRIWGPPRPTAITPRRRLSSAGPPLLQRSLAVRAPDADLHYGVRSNVA